MYLSAVLTSTPMNLSAVLTSIRLVPIGLVGTVGDSVGDSDGVQRDGRHERQDPLRRLRLARATLARNDDRLAAHRAAPRENP